ncbi:MAG: hypothetical protein U0X71_09495 [Sphingobacteriaceae bacterium]|jgi:hypothetical protein
MGAFDKLKNISHTDVPRQQVVPIKKKKRDDETPFTFWIQKDLFKALKLKAFETDDNMKNVVVKALIEYLK